MKIIRNVMIVAAAVAAFASCNEFKSEYTPDYTLVTMTFEQNDSTDFTPRFLQDGDTIQVEEAEDSGCFVSDRYLTLYAHDVTEFTFLPDSQGNSSYIYQQLYVRTNCPSVMFVGKDTADVVRMISISPDTLSGHWVRVDLTTLSEDPVTRSLSPLKSLQVLPDADTLSSPFLHLDNISLRIQ